MPKNLEVYGLPFCFRLAKLINVSIIYNLRYLIQTGIKVKSINITDETKTVFDMLQIELSSFKGKMLSQDETILELIKCYNEQKVKP